MLLRCLTRHQFPPATGSIPSLSSSLTRCTPLRGRKNRVYVITQVDRATRCFIAYEVASDRAPLAGDAHHCAVRTAV